MPKLINIIKERYPLKRLDDKVLMEQKLTKRGFQISWVLQTDNPSPFMVKHNGANSYYIAANGVRTGLFSRLLYNFICFLNTLRIFGLKGKYDFIQVKDSYLSGIGSLIYAKLKRIPFVFWLSFPFPESSLHKAKEMTARYPKLYIIRGHVYGFIQYQILMPMADHIFVQSEQMKYDLVEHGIPENKMTPVPMGVPLEEFPDWQELESDRHEPNTVCYLGSMNKVRHLDFILRAFAHVLMQVHDAKMYMVGGGDEDDDILLLKQEAHRLGLGKAVVFTGELPRDEAFTFVRRASVCLSPFYPSFIFNSTSPTKLVEYMALGIACVANDHSEQKVVLSQSGAGLSVPWDEKLFALAIVSLLKDEKIVRTMGKNGRHYVERYRNYDTIADFLSDKYREICNK